MIFSDKDINKIINISNEIEEISTLNDNEIIVLFNTNKKLTSIFDNIFKKYNETRCISINIYNDICKIDNQLVRRLLNLYLNYKEYQILEKLDEVEEINEDYYFTDSVKQYYSKIYKISILTPEEEKELGKKIKLNDKKAKEELLNHNLRLAFSIARYYVGRGVLLEDLVQHANIGLMKAVDNYDVDRGTRFSTYAVPKIRQAVTKGIADEHRTIKIPTSIYMMAKQVKVIMNEYFSVTGKEMTKELVAVKTGYDMDTVDKIFSSFQTITSIDKQISDENNNEIVDLIRSDDKSVEDKAIDDYLKIELFNVLNTLKPREKDVIIRRFGLNGFFPEKLREISKEYGITCERVRKIEETAIRKIKKNEKLRDFYLGSE